MPTYSVENCDKTVIKSLSNWLSRGQGTGRARSIAGSSIGISTDQGTSRSENQDKAAVGFFYDDQSSFIVLILSDGMGGMASGAYCATLSVSAALERSIALRKKPAKERLESMVGAANELVHREYAGQGGATLSLLLIDERDGAWISNVGDSRVYAIKEKEIMQLTVDDTVNGRLGGQKVPNIPTNAILQYVGMGSDIEIPTENVSSLSETHSFLLTSDGAHYPDDSVILALQNNSSAPEIFSRRLTEVAKWVGSRDNLTSIATRTVPSLFENLKASNPRNVLQVWDAYGDLTLISPEEKEMQGKQTSRKPQTRVKEEASIKHPNDSGSKAEDRKTKSRSKAKPRSDKSEDKKPTIQADIFSSNSEKE